MNTCQTCRYWTGKCDEQPKFKKCSHPKNQPFALFQEPALDGFGVFDEDEASRQGEFASGPDFGCIHHQPKECYKRQCELAQ